MLATQVSDIVNAMHEERFPAESIIYMTGEPSSKMYVVISGEVGLHHTACVLDEDAKDAEKSIEQHTSVVVPCCRSNEKYGRASMSKAALRIPYSRHAPPSWTEPGLFSA